MYQLVGMLVFVLVFLVTVVPRVRYGLLEVAYRSVQFLIGAAAIALLVFCVSDLQIETTANDTFQHAVTVTMKALQPSYEPPLPRLGSPPNTTWISRGLALALPSLLLLIVVQFLREMSSISATHRNMRREFKSAYKAIAQQISQIRLGNDDSDVGDIEAAVKQLNHLFKNL